MKVSYDSEELIQEASGDLMEFGENLLVFAIYSWFEEYQSEFITDYIWAEKPERLNIGYWDKEDEEDYQKELKNYNDSLKTLEMTKYEKMIVKRLLELLEEQNSTF